MTLADLLTTLDTRGALPASRVKDMRTSLRYLASALGETTPDHSSVGEACRDPTAWAAALETHWRTLEAQGRTISAITRRNTRNNLRVLFRAAEAHGLLQVPLPPRLLTKPRRMSFESQQRRTAPYQTTYHVQDGPRRFGLPQAQWPPDVQAGWREYRTKCGRRIRETTFQAYVKCLMTYLGYLTYVVGRTPTWDDLFDVAQLRAFLDWHGARLQCPISAHGLRVVITVAAMANVLKHPHAGTIAALRGEQPLPEPLHRKRAHWVSLRELEAVAEACLAEGRAPLVHVYQRRHLRHPGSQRAAQFQHGLILKLLVRVPLRQRNVRELRVDKNLYRDQAGHWQLHFSGAELKIGTRQARPNEYTLNLSQDTDGLVPVLEEWLREYRPRLPNAATSPFLFLTQGGRPFTEQTLRVELISAVGLRTGQRFYPHLIRTIWATEYIEKTRDFTGAAHMLGDTVATVLQAYQHILGKDQHAKAKAFLSTALHTG
jgi:hypothetical protein